MLTESPPARSWSEERRLFVEAGGNTTHAFGLGRIIGRLYALLYLTPAPLSLEEIAAQLAVSKASASVTVRQLADLRAVRQVWVPGDRRDFYEAETRFGVILREGVLPGVRKKLRSAGGQIERTLATDQQEAAPGSGADTLGREQRAELRRRLRAARTLHRRLDRLLASKLLTKIL
jgi:DNA-binding transcriptional regulator GbsR (MarR family)